MERPPVHVSRALPVLLAPDPHRARRSSGIPSRGRGGPCCGRARWPRSSPAASACRSGARCATACGSPRSCPRAPARSRSILAGRRLDRLPVAGGQFLQWRFLRKGLWWQAHPYSLSSVPAQNRMRITVKDLGDHSRGLAALRARHEGGDRRPVRRLPLRRAPTRQAAPDRRRSRQRAARLTARGPAQARRRRRHHPCQHERGARARRRPRAPRRARTSDPPHRPTRARPARRARAASPRPRPRRPRRLRLRPGGLHRRGPRTRCAQPERPISTTNPSPSRSCAAHPSSSPPPPSASPPRSGFKAHQPTRTTAVAATTTAQPAATATATATTKSKTPSKSGTATGDAIPTQYGNAQVRVTVKNGKITKVEALQLQGNDPKSYEISSYAEPYLRQSALTKQSAAIDVVSGATFTSASYAQSLQSALDQLGFKAADGSRNTLQVPQGRGFR